MFTALDHIALVVRDLPAALERYTALLGAEPNWHGTDEGVEHAWFQLDNMALDIVAPISEGMTADRARQRLDAHGEGIWALAFATPDIAKARHVLERRGVRSSAPQTIRSTHVRTGEHRIWNTSVLSPQDTHGTILLAVEQAAAAWPRSPNIAESKSGISGLDHVVVTTAHAERAVALYGARLGLDMKLDRTNADWGSRLLFFKCGDLIVEIAQNLKNNDEAAPDKAWGLSWRAANIDAAHSRMKQSGFSVSDVRVGRKPGTKVFTVREAPASVPTLILGKV